jgi:hypothetical protein
MAGTLTPNFESAHAAVSKGTGVVIDCDPQLIESAVFASVRGTTAEQAYQSAREVCYLETDPEYRDRAFAALNEEWFARLRLARPVFDALAERPAVIHGTSRCVLAPGMRRQDESAELYGHMKAGSARGDDTKPVLVLRLRPESFNSPAHILALLRHELLHIADMLDPGFGYDASPSQFYDDTGVPTAIRDRYRVLWDVHIDARLYREGRAAHEVRTRRFSEFSRGFVMLGPRVTAAFDSVFEADILTHENLVAFARTPMKLIEHVGLVRPMAYR